MKTCPMKTRIFHANVLKMCVGWGFFEIRRWVFTQLFPRMHFQSVPGCNQGSRMRRFPITRVDWKLRLVDFFSTAIFFLYPLEGKVHFDASKYTGLFYGYLRWFPDKSGEVFSFSPTHSGWIFSGWWQLKYVLFSHRSLGFHDPIWRTRIFFKWIGEKPPTRRIFAEVLGCVSREEKFYCLASRRPKGMCVSSLFLGQTICWEPSREGAWISLLSSLAKNGKVQLFQAAKIV